MAREDAFLEHAQVFDHWYGTGREHVAGLRAAGFTVVLEIDWQGARQVRERAPGSHSVFILPPSVAELERRLRGRKTDSEAVIARRLKDARSDMTHWAEFEHVIVNDDFDAALERLARRDRRPRPRRAHEPGRPCAPRPRRSWAGSRGRKACSGRGVLH